MNCNTSAGLTIAYYIKIAMDIIFISAPILLLVLGTIDILKVVVSDSEKSMKSSISTFLKRIVICVIILILPALINLVVSIFGFNIYNECFTKATKANIETLEKAEKENKLKEESALKEEKERQSHSIGSTDSEKGEPLTNVEPGLHLKNYNSMDYFEVIPPNIKSSMPLVIFLHGDGGYWNFSEVGNSTVTNFVKNGDAYSDGEFIFLAPHGAREDWYSDGITNKLMSLIDHITEEYKIDKNRIYLTGHSRGAMGVWSIANKYPNKFAAIVPISGTGNINAYNFINTPARVFASYDESDLWCYSNSRDNCNKIVAAGGKCDFITLSSTHGQTANTAYTKELFNWLLNQK